jgi:hypothetical protein
MTASPEKAPKKVKDKRQTPQERLELMRYNHMMYGPTEGELKLAPKKIDFGASYLKHPKFQNLMTAFRRGAAFTFDITLKGSVSSIATDGSHITFDGRTLFYARPLNKHEDNLFLDRATAVQYQTNDAVIHLVFAVLRSFPELGEPLLLHMYHKFFYGPESLESVAAGHGSNILIGPYQHNKPHERPKN